MFYFRYLLIGVTCHVRQCHFIAMLRFKGRQYTYDGLTPSPHVMDGRFIGEHKVQNCMYIHADPEIVD